MPEKRIHQPHDKLLKDTFRSPQNASAFFQHHLPTPLTRTLNWNTLSLEPRSFIDPDYTASESDLLFRVRMEDSEAFVYLLFEHQSSEDPRIALRLLSYILQIWNRFAKEHPAPVKLPPVLPLVLPWAKVRGRPRPVWRRSSICLGLSRRFSGPGSRRWPTTRSIEIVGIAACREGSGDAEFLFPPSAPAREEGF